MNYPTRSSGYGPAYASTGEQRYMRTVLKVMEFGMAECISKPLYKVNVNVRFGSSQYCYACIHKSRRGTNYPCDSLVCRPHDSNVDIS